MWTSCWQKKKPGACRTLLLIAAIGGSLGSLLGMLVAHHKTRKAKFYILVPLLLVLHAAAAGWYFLR